MHVNVKCKCGAILQISEDDIGKRAQCPQCQNIFTIPESLRAKFAGASGGSGAPAPPPPGAFGSPPPHKKGGKGSRKLVIIGGGVAAFLLLVGLVWIILTAFGFFSDTKDAAVPPPTDSPAVRPATDPAQRATARPTRVDFGSFTNPDLECARRMMEIYEALDSYTQAKGEYPENLAALSPDFIEADQVASLICPHAGRADLLDASYEYVGSEIASISRFRMLLWDRESRHENGRRAALFSDGRVSLITGDEFDSLRLARRDGQWVTPAEDRLLSSLQPQVRVVNRRFAGLRVIVNGEDLGAAAYGAAADFPAAAGPASIIFALGDQRTDPLDITLSSGTVYSVAFPAWRELPAINIRTMDYYALHPNVRGRRPTPAGPPYDAVTITEAGQQRLAGLRAANETLNFIAPPGLEQGAASPRIELERGRIYGEIVRGDITISGLAGEPIKVHDIQRLAEGVVTRADGRRDTYLLTSIGTVTVERMPNLNIASAAMLKDVNGVSPWPGQQPDMMNDYDMYMRHQQPGQPARERRMLVEMPKSFDVDPPSFVDFIDYDAIAPAIRDIGRPAVGELLDRLAVFAAPPQVRPRAAPAPVYRQPEQMETKPISPRWLSGGDMMDYGYQYGEATRRGGLLGPSTVREDDPYGMYGDRMMYDEPRSGIIEPGERETLIQALGFYLRPWEKEHLLPFVAGARDGAATKPFAVLALGRVGSPLAIHRITGWADWEGGPPKKLIAQPVRRDPDDMGPGDMPMDDIMSYDTDMMETDAADIPAAVALAMIDSPLNEPGLMRLGWFGRIEDKTRSEGLDYPGRMALARLIKNWTPDQLALAMRAWPEMGDWWPRHNFMMALAQSENRNLNDPGLLAEAYRFAPSSAAEMARRLMNKERNVASAQLLCKMGDARTIGEMLALAQSTNAREAHIAVMSLSLVDDTIAFEPLEKAVKVVLQSGAPSAKVEALNAWVALNKRTGADLGPVVELAQSQAASGEEQLRAAAVKTLVSLIPSQGVEILAPALESTHKTTIIAALNALAEHGAGTRRADEPVSGAAAPIDEAIRGWGRRSGNEGVGGDNELAPLILKAFDTQDKEVLVAAIRAAGGLGVTDAAPRIAALMDERGGRVEEEELLIACARALGDIREQAFTPQLLLALRDPSAKVRLAVAEALGRIGSPAAAAELGRAMVDENADVRMAAVRALGGIRDPRAYRALIDVAFPVELAYTNVSWPALQTFVKVNDPAAYQQLGERIGPNDVWIMWSVVNAVYNELPPEQRDVCVEFLAGYLRSEHTWLKVLAAHGMAELERPEQARRLINEIQPDPYGMVAPIARILGDNGAREDLPRLERMLANYRIFRGTPPGGVGDMGDYGGYYMPGMDEGPPEVTQQQEVPQRIDPRLVVFQAMGKIGGPEAVQSLARQTRVPDEPLRHVISALGDSASGDAVNQLVAVGRRVESNEMRMAVLEALSKVAHLDRANAERMLNDVKRSENAELSAAAAEMLDAMQRQLARDW